MHSEEPTLRDRGREALRRGDAGEAARLLAEATRAEPGEARNHALLGVALSQLDRHAAAQQSLERAIRLAPEHAPHYFNLGVALEHAGRADAALDAYRRCLERDPAHRQARACRDALERPPAPAAPPEGAAPAPLPAAEAAADEDAPQPPPPGTTQCPACGEWSRISLTCEHCAAHLPPPNPALTYAPGGRDSLPPELADPATAAAFLKTPESASLNVSPRTQMAKDEALFRRLVAAMVDQFLVNAVVMLMLRIFVTAFSTFEMDLFDPTPGLLAILLLGGGVVRAGYAGWMLPHRGATLGKMALGLKVLDASGNHLTLGKALLRETLGKTISDAVCCGLASALMWFDLDQRTLHDHIAQTYVVKVASGAVTSVSGYGSFGE